MLGRQASYERLSLKREDGGRESKPMRDVYKLARELRSMRDVYKEGGLCVACQMSKSENRQVQTAWRRETSKLENAVATEA